MGEVIEVPKMDEHARQAVDRLKNELQCASCRQPIQPDSVVAKCRVLHDCWVIRCGFPTRREFATFINSSLSGVLDSDLAWRMAETWEIAQPVPALRTLVFDRPDEAVALVREFLDSGNLEVLERFVADHDAVAEIVLLSPRRRRARLREYIQSQIA